MNPLKNKFNTIRVPKNVIRFLMGILKFKDFFISLGLCFLIFLIVFAIYNTFFVFCDNECHLVIEANQLNSDKNLIEKVKILEEELKECQKKTEELEFKAKKSSILGWYLVGTVVIMYAVEVARVAYY